MEVVIRPYSAGDRSAVERLVVEMQEHERQIDPRLRPGVEIAARYTDAMLARSESLAGVLLVAESGGAIVGFAAVLARVPNTELDAPPEPYALVADLAVTAGHRRRGIGCALLRAAESYARSRGAPELRIAVLDGNVGAERLYRRFGFTPYLEVLTKSLHGDG